MTGPQHYMEAQRLIVEANDSATYHLKREALIAEAQVHALLAVAAAAATPISSQQQWLSVQGLL